MGKARAKAKAPQTSVTLDTGALMALERGDRRMIALLSELARARARCHVPAGVVGQAWRGGPQQAVLARLLKAREVIVEPLDDALARACGELCAATGTSDVIDASVVLVAGEHAGVILTSDVEDLRRLDPHAALERV
jgi:hypothetical protein